MAAAQNGVLDLSTLRKKNNGQQPDANAPQAQENQGADAAVRATTAYIVFIEPSGAVQVTSDLSMTFARDRIPTVDDVYTSQAVIKRDLDSQVTATQTAQAMAAMAQQQMQQMRDQSLAAGLNLPKG